MNKKRVLVLTGTTDIVRQPSETDNLMEEVFDLTLPSKINYAKKHGYDILAIRSFGTDKSNFFEDLNIGCLRVLRTIEMLNFYDSVFWIDADSIITNQDLTVEDFHLEDKLNIICSWDWNGKYSFSTGNFILNKNDNINNFFQTFLNVSKHCTSEQQTINMMYRHTDMQSNIKILDHSYLNAVPKQQELYDVWKDRMKIYSPWTPNSFLAHLTGIPNRDRIDVLKKYFSEYL